MCRVHGKFSSKAVRSRHGGQCTIVPSSLVQCLWLIHSLSWMVFSLTPGLPAGWVGTLVCGKSLMCLGLLTRAQSPWDSSSKHLLLGETPGHPQLETVQPVWGSGAGGKGATSELSLPLALAHHHVRMGSDSQEKHRDHRGSRQETQIIPPSPLFGWHPQPTAAHMCTCGEGVSPRWWAREPTPPLAPLTSRGRKKGG